MTAGNAGTDPLAEAYRAAERRFWPKVDRSGECWTWTAATGDGYGQFYFNGRLMRAHRWAYEAFVGPIPEGLQLDHLCRNRACVRPDHLEPVNNRENTRRGGAAEAIRDRQATQTHCLRGHEFTPENTRMARGTQRRCRECTRILTQEHRDRRKADAELGEKVRNLLADEGTVETVAEAICISASGWPDHYGAWSHEARAALDALAGLIGGEDE